MSELGFTPDEIISILSQSNRKSYILLAAMVLVVYDAILTWPQEWKCIWKRKFSAVTLLYVLIRYGIILNMFIQNFGGFWIFTTASSCKAVAILYYIIETVCAFAIAAFNCLRIWAICKKRWFPVTVVFLLSMFTPCVNIYNFSRSQTWTIVPSGPLVGCWDISTTEVYQYFPVITRAISVGSDLAVLVFTLLETVQIWRIGQSAHAKTKLTTMLIYNGALHFLVFLILNTISVILNILSVATLLTTSGTASFFTTMMTSVISILLSHFLLDLRSTFQSGSNNFSSFQQDSSVHFASSILGDMGATLDAPWTTKGDEDRDAEENQIMTYSKNTFAMRLLETETGQKNDQEIVEAGPSGIHNLAQR